MLVVKIHAPGREDRILVIYGESVTPLLTWLEEGEEYEILFPLPCQQSCQIFDITSTLKYNQYQELPLS